ncbi:MAG TPA: acetyl-CoA decarbonylase/synthase complex subunit gamma [Methanomicrobiales archaeon]|nr:acetyl-CoA decarbonylase/synthase complex subunit gamma [Methanomicrobiales archaeon]
MALKALDIYKMLPKKNCKECGFPTCLTFAMKLAAGKADADACPYLDDATKALLHGATRPPIQLVKLGVGERQVPVGDEIVLFRHEKAFYHPPAILFSVSDLWDRDRIVAAAERVMTETFPRVGENLRFNGLAVRNDSGSAEAFGKAVGVVEEVAEFPEVLVSASAGALEAGLARCGNYRPVIHAATTANHAQIAPLAKRFGCSLVVRAGGLAELAGLAKACADLGVRDLVLDPGASTLGEFLASSTEIRRRAIDRSDPDLGHPVYLDATGFAPEEAAIVTGILKYAGIIVTSVLPQGTAKMALTLRQNIYTDPQKPIQMTPGLYRVGEPGPDSPVLATVNFSLTYFTLLGYLEASRIPCHLLIVDTEGFSVLTAVAAGKFSERLVKDSLDRFQVAGQVNHRSLVIPGYAAPLSGRIEEVTGWKVLVGPRDAADIGEFLEKEWVEKGRAIRAGP